MILQEISRKCSLLLSAVVNIRKCSIVIFVGQKPLLYPLYPFTRMGSLRKLFILRLRLNYQLGSGTVSFCLFFLIYQTNCNSVKSCSPTLLGPKFSFLYFLLLSISTKLIFIEILSLTTYKVLKEKHRTSIFNN